MLQMVNDNADFIPARFEEKTRAKFADDAFSDLRNCNVTLPSIIHLFKTPEKAGEIRHYLGEQSEKVIFSLNRVEPLDERVFFDKIIKSHAIFLSMSIPKKLKEWSFEFLNHDNHIYRHIMELLSLVDNNKYYKYFYKQEEYKNYREKQKERNISKKH